MTGTGLDLDLLLTEGRPVVDTHLARERPPTSALEWLGIALTGRCRPSARSPSAARGSAASRHRAEQVRSAFVAALGSLLAYSELAAERRVHVHG